MWEPDKTSGLDAAKRWMYRHGRPGRLAAIANRIQAVAAARGMGTKHVVALEVRGRKSGKLLTFPVVVADYQGDRYLVAMLGENANWVRNVEAAGGRVVIRHGRPEQVHLERLEQGAKGEILRRYLEVAPGARPHIPVDRQASALELERVAANYPMFRICPERE